MFRVTPPVTIRRIGQFVIYNPHAIELGYRVNVHRGRLTFIFRVLFVPLLTLQVGARRVHGVLRRGAGRDAIQVELLERRQRAAVDRSGEGGAAGVGDLGAVEVEHLELRQPSRRRRRRTCRRSGATTHEGL